MSQITHYKASSISEVESKIAEIKSTGTKNPIILKFYSDMCPPCRRISADLVNYIGSPVNLISIDCKVARDLVDKYSVRAIPEFVVINDKLEVLIRKCLSTMVDFNIFVEEGQIATANSK